MREFIGAAHCRSKETFAIGTSGEKRPRLSEKEESLKDLPLTRELHWRGRRRGERPRTPLQMALADGLDAGALQRQL